MDNPKGNILYLDDEPQNLEVFKVAYRKSYNIFTATTPKEAFEILHQHPISVILSDQRMPEMTGVQFLEAVIPVYPDPIRMLISAYSDADAIIKAINKGRVFRFIPKPWDDQELKQSLEMAIKMYELNTKNRELLQEMHDEAVKQERILSLFKKYVPAKAISDSIDEDPEHLFTGEMRVISVLYVSIKNINVISENNDSKQIMSYLNEFFDITTNCIEQYKGIVDKIMGGTILAIFGAPISSIDNQKNAVFSGICMLEKIIEFNKKYENVIKNTTEINIAIHSGEAIVGNIGSEQYITYTALGDTVNTAARLSEIANKSSNSIMVSEAIYQDVKNDIGIEFVSEEKIRGKNKPVKLYKITSTKIEEAQK